MSLLHKFDKTIFYKSDSELERKIEALKKLSNEFPNNDIIRKKLKIMWIRFKGRKRNRIWT